MESSTTLIFKNIPKQINNLEELLNNLHIPPKEIKPFGRRRALIYFNSSSDADNALEKISQLEFGGKLANVSIFVKDRLQLKNTNDCLPKPLKKSHKGVQTHLNARCATMASVELQQINKYVQKLYATERDLCFDQPPPPYLKYQYPPVNKAIMDNICMALMSNTKFYTQVLHLMNRMNLEPPFQQRTKRIYPKGTPKEVSTQTENVVITECRSSETSESELESSDENDSKKKLDVVYKRKLPASDEQYKKKARQMLQTMQKLSKKTVNKSTKVSKPELFDPPITNVLAHSSNIQVNISQETITKDKALSIELHDESGDITLNSVVVGHLDLTTNRIDEKEMQAMPIFKNYNKGNTSNKLYIKNLQKDVVTEDLHSLYRRVIHNDKVQLDIKVMQHGRMKGQAFVTFTSDHLTMSELQNVASDALNCTNGYILRSKPMVVCFGKQS
uniref:RRM domain-containing protein n=1 Tax=Stomoxys calcitrans TaxID=35570 RepID=A0A1I8NSU2_STOCA